VPQFKLSNDPKFFAKLRYIVGLYVNPLRIPTQSGHRFLFDAGHHTEMKPAT
jgi:hypothetical protein